MAIPSIRVTLLEMLAAGTTGAAVQYMRDETNPVSMLYGFTAAVGTYAVGKFLTGNTSPEPELPLHNNNPALRNR